MNESEEKELKMPVLFIGHGSPMNIVSDNKFTQNLKKLGPLIYTIALQEKDDPVKFIHEGYQYGSVSMRCLQIG
ncbi:MAG: hypothetical protein ACFFB6_12145 [Promethearchaeota archaeon]